MLALQHVVSLFKCQIAIDSSQRSASGSFQVRVRLHQLSQWMVEELFVGDEPVLFLLEPPKNATEVCQIFGLVQFPEQSINMDLVSHIVCDQRLTVLSQVIQQCHIRCAFQLMGLSVLLSPFKRTN